MGKDSCGCGGDSCCSLKNIGMFVLMVLLAVAIGLGVLGLVTPNKGLGSNSYASLTDMRNTVSVSGSAKTTVAPDTAHLSIGVVTEAKTAVEAQSANAAKMAAVKSAIIDAGIDNAGIETDYFYTDPVYTGKYVCPEDIPNCTKDEKVWDYILTGYKTTHTLSVKTTTLDKVGSVLDAAVKAGANNIDSISFTLDETKEKELKLQLLVQATVDAKKQADTLATAAGVAVVKPLSISQTSYYPPSPYYYSMETNEVSAAAPSTSISPGTVDVSVNVAVIYEVQ